MTSLEPLGKKNVQILANTPQLLSYVYISQIVLKVFTVGIVHHVFLLRVISLNIHRGKRVAK